MRPSDVRKLFEAADKVANSMLQAQVDRSPGCLKSVLKAVAAGDANFEIRVIAPANRVELFACVRDCEPFLIGSITPSVNLRTH